MVGSKIPTYFGQISSPFRRSGFIRNDFATSKNFRKNKKLPFKIGEKIRNVTSKKEILKKHISFK